MASSIIERTRELADAFASRVWVMHIAPPSRQAAPFNVDSSVLRHEAAAELCNQHEFLQYLAHCLRERGIDAGALLLEGPTIRTLLKEAQRLDIDLIILGCHKHDALYGVLLEFTEEGLLSKCPCPIMFVPVPE
jgi:nucleotide-binding universal stress UspA family protein